MGKNKLAKFDEMASFPHVFQVSAQELTSNQGFELKGKWKQYFFGNNNPVVLELGCGKGEYSVGLAGIFPHKNFIGVDIKGARMWSGAKDSLMKGLKNIAFIRTNIEMIHHFFSKDEVDEIWLTFPDPQMKKVTKRLTATNFMKQYQGFVKNDGIIHLKTDSNFMFTYTLAMVKVNEYPVVFSTKDLYASALKDPILNITTYYEQQWLNRGIPIKYLSFKLIQKELLSEPEIEIEKDSYRSFGRQLMSQTIQTRQTL